MPKHRLSVPAIPLIILLTAFISEVTWLLIALSFWENIILLGCVFMKILLFIIVVANIKITDLDK